MEWGKACKIRREQERLVYGLVVRCYNENYGGGGEKVSENLSIYSKTFMVRLIGKCKVADRTNAEIYN